MSLSERLQELLVDECAWYRIQPWRGAQEARTPVHSPAEVTAHTVVLRDGDGAFLMLALPAGCAPDLASIRRATGRRALRAATESEAVPLFPDCAAGAMPPFGRLYGLPLLADARLLGSRDILFRGGAKDTLVRTRLEDWLSIARPIVGAFSMGVPRAPRTRGPSRREAGPSAGP
jgi:Ala-tRNA(Pro) deacylase